MRDAGTVDPIGTVGFIGVGEIAKAMVEGLASDDGRPTPIVLSPRGREHARQLSSRFDTVRVAGSNGDVARESDTVVLAVRPEQLTTALDGVRFRSSQVVVSALAGVDIAELRAVIGAEIPVIRSIPLPPVSRRSSRTVICPDHPVAASLFDRLGGTLAVADETELAVFSAITGSFTGLLQYVATVAEWAERQGAPALEAERFIRTAFAEL
ncbi:MAG TPA: NAD(P)-binding domain-containing protein, partial [Candidatus Agrococcus pullicola]|nr:NAD(P)-binding domain-containing protein [Candidatus Agrococcus pullicola]